MITPTVKIETRQYYKHDESPCSKTCPERKAECAKTCPKWAKYEHKRTERYKHNEKVYAIEEVLKPHPSRDKRGQR